MAWGLAVLAWIGVVAAGIVAVVCFYKKHLANTNNIERVTVIREVLVQPQGAPQIVTAESEPRPYLDERAGPTAESISYRSMLSGGDQSAEPESEPHSSEPHSNETDQRPNPSVSYRSLLVKGDKKEDELK